MWTVRVKDVTDYRPWQPILQYAIELEPDGERNKKLDLKLIVNFRPFGNPDREGVLKALSGWLEDANRKGTLTYKMETTLGREEFMRGLLKGATESI